MVKIYIGVCGGGLGHASRMVALAKYLEENGYDVVFGSYGKAIDFIKSHGFNCLEVPEEILFDGKNGKVDIKRIIWKSKSFPINLIKSIYFERKIISRYGFDIIISDYRYSTIFAGKILRKPVLFVTNANSVDIGYWKIKEYTKKISARILNTVFLKADKVLIPDFYIPYTICLYNLYIKNTEKIRFIGPLIRYDPREYNYSKEIVFCTFGGEKYKLPLYYKLKEIADQNKDIHFVVACGLEEVKGLNSDNFEVHSYIKDVDKYLCRAKATILHGGLTSIHETLCFGKAPLILYDKIHTEQKNNALRVKELGAGEIIEIDEIDQNIFYEKLKKVMKIDNSKFRKIYLKMNPKKSFLEEIEKLVKK